MSVPKTIVLTDGVFDIVYKKIGSQLNSLATLPMKIEERGCGCKGKPKILKEVVDYSAAKNLLANDQNDLAAVKAFLNVDNLVLFVKQDGQTVRKII